MKKYFKKIYRIYLSIFSILNSQQSKYFLFLICNNISVTDERCKNLLIFKGKNFKQHMEKMNKRSFYLILVVIISIICGVGFTILDNYINSFI